MKKVSEAFYQLIALSFTLTILESIRLGMLTSDHLSISILSAWGMIVVAASIAVLSIHTITALTKKSWPKIADLSWTDLLSLLILISIFSALLVFCTQWSVEWSSKRFRMPLYRGLFAGFIALGCSLFSMISLPAIWYHLRHRLAKNQLSNTIPKHLLPVILALGSLGACISASSFITTFIFPNLETVDLRLPQLLLYGLWSLIFFPKLIAKAYERQMGHIKKGILITLVISVIFSLYQSSHLSPIQALRIERDTAFTRLIMKVFQDLTDFDRDGVSALWGGGDCNDNNPKIRPGVADQFGDKDLNCNFVISGKDRGDNPLLISSSENFSASKQQGPYPQNLILLTIDALRYDAYLEAMPNTRQFAKNALDFTNAYSAGAATYWSIPALLGSRPPSFFKMGRDQTPVNSERLLTESLRDAGFHTALFANVTIFFVRGLSQGAYTKNYDTSRYTVHGAKPGSAHLTDGLIRHIDRWRQGKLRPKRDRLMLWGHYYDPHDPYFEIEDQGGGSDHERYLKIVRSVDKELGRLFTALKDRKMLEHTMVVITADHGDEFQDHGHRFHGKTLYDEMVRVPLIIYSPQYQPREVTDVFSHIDVAPTLLSHLRIKPEERFLGHNWDQELNVGRPLIGSQAFFEVLPDQNYTHHLVGLRRGKQKLISHVRTGAFEHYHLENDPKELHNLATYPPKNGLYSSLMEYVEQQLHQLSKGEAGVKLP